MKKTPELFDAWNEQKKRIEFGKSLLLQPKQGEFWWYWEGVNIGSEISKDGNFKRPCLIVWVYSGRCCIIPLTTKGFGNEHHGTVLFESSKKYYLKQSWFLVNYLKIIDIKRLSHKHTQKRVNSNIQTLLGFFLCIYKKTLLRREEYPDAKSVTNFWSVINI